MSLVLIGNLTHPSSGEQHTDTYLLSSAELKIILIHTAGRKPYIWNCDVLSDEIDGVVSIKHAKFWRWTILQCTVTSPVIQNTSNKFWSPMHSICAHYAKFRKSISGPPTWMAAPGSVSFFQEWLLCHWVRDLWYGVKCAKKQTNMKVFYNRSTSGLLFNGHWKDCLWCFKPSWAIPTLSPCSFQR